ncbi:MAG: T9SS type A sorting domain-containing protein [Sphingobacteriaceae bacterium]|nr:T9SS type A sorting domain-containing protein [Sphingobacteriaceae bacterium]
MKLKLSIAILLALFGFQVNAQVSGVVTVPGTYTSIAAAINDLNTVGVSGTVNVDIAAGYTETAPVGGYTLTASGTSTSQITFQKSGVGANPLITANAGGTGTPGTAIQDGVWRLVGSDYITIDGIDIMDPNVANPATMEFGYGLLKASATNGCQYNTIKNCVITLNRVNNATGTAPAVDGSRGIDVVNALTAAHTSILTVTAASGTNSYNMFYGNTIQNCNIGISLIGYAASTPFTNADTNNDIGGTSALTGNTIVNYGGGGTANPAAAIRTLAQYNLNVSYNNINNNNGSGISHGTTLRGIYLNTAVSANVVVNSNTLTMNGGATTSLLNAIENISGSTPATNTVSISNNIIQNSTYTTATSGNFGCIINSGSPATLNVMNNLVNNNTLSGTGTFTGIDGGGSNVATVLALSSNTVTNNSKTGVSGTFYCMRASTASLTVNGNIINNNSIPSTSGTGSSTMAGYYNIASPVFEVHTNNRIDNLMIGGTSTSTGHTIYGMYSNTASSSIKTYSGNVIHTLSTAPTLAGGTIYGIYHALTGTTNIFKNKIYSLTSEGAGGFCHGMYISSGNTVNIYNNTIGNLSTPSTNNGIALTGIYFNGGSSHNVFYNTVYLTGASTGALFGSSALYTSTTPTINVRNNVFINTSTASGAGFTSAFRRSSATIATFSNSSNNNILYTGTPSASNVIYYDGTTSYQTLATYQAAVTPRETNSGTENTPFLSTVGASTNFLHVDPVLPSLTESGAVNIAGITDDYDADIRQGNPGYTGSGFSPDMGADEYNQILPGCTTASGGTQSTTSFTRCAGQTVGLNSTGFTIGSGVLYQWQVSSVPSGPYSNVIGGTGATTPSYTTGALPAGTYYYVLLTTCTITSVTGTSNESTVTVNAVPTASASSNSPICEGQTLNFTAGTDIGTNFIWTGPSSFTSTTQNPNISSTTSSLSGIYNLIVSNGNCTATAVSTTVSINATPGALTVTPTSGTLCAGSPQTVTAVGGEYNSAMAFGTQANQNSASTTAAGYPAPYSVYYGGQRMQVLVLASELTAAGFVANSKITSVQFPVVSKGANWGVGVMDCQNFQVNIGTTALNSLTAFQTGLSNVVAPMSFTPVVGYSNTHTFSTPFIWNGTSNIILESTFSNSISGVTGDLVTQYNSPTGFSSTIVYRADNVSAATASAATTVNFTYNARPDFRLNGSSPAVYLWSPAAGLSSVNTLTTVASPTTTTNYILTAANSVCTSTAAVSFTVSPLPTLSVTPNPSVLCTGNSATLTVGGANSYNWTSVGTGSTIVVSPTVNTTYTVSGVDANGCIDSTTFVLTVSPCTGIDALLAGNSVVNVYPNPTTGLITLVISDVTKATELEVFDAIGKKVLTQTISNSQTLINMNELANGIYSYRVKNSEGYISQGKLVKE